MECLRVQLAKKPHHNASRSRAPSRTSVGTEQEKQGHDPPPMSLHVDPSASFAPPRSVESRASAGKMAALARNIAPFRSPTKDPRRPDGVTVTSQTPASSDLPRAPLVVANQRAQQASQERLVSSSSHISVPPPPPHLKTRLRLLSIRRRSTTASMIPLQPSQQRNDPTTLRETSQDRVAPSSEQMVELPANVEPAETGSFGDVVAHVEGSKNLAHQMQATGQPTPLARVKIETEDAEPVPNAEPEPPQTTSTATATSERQTQAPEAEQERHHFPAFNDSMPRPITTQQQVSRGATEHHLNSPSGTAPDATQPAKRDSRLQGIQQPSLAAVKLQEARWHPLQCKDVPASQLSRGRPRSESRSSRSEHRPGKDPDRRASGEQSDEGPTWQRYPPRSKSGNRDATQDYIRRLSSVWGPKGHYYEPYYLCAWLGKATKLTGNVSATTPVVIALTNL